MGKAIGQRGLNGRETYAGKIFVHALRIGIEREMSTSITNVRPSLRTEHIGGDPNSITHQMNHSSYASLRRMMRANDAQLDVYGQSIRRQDVIHTWLGNTITNVLQTDVVRRNGWRRIK